ncbi:hypothetical protein M9Y10_007402 [Tritrichomonas musculus]|uniref:Initiator binding domain-containing protein n=1 Tax=Tritrichomonas musculus TaxID=1915356 RepID=A0ABR2J277_9EUKA
MDLETFRHMVMCKKPKMKQTHIVLECLKFVDNNPESLPRVGCCWKTDQIFMIHSGIFGNFIGRDANTINRNFRTHGFIQRKSSASMRKAVPKKFNFDHIPDPKNWYERERSGFTKETTAKDLIYFSFQKPTPKKPKSMENTKTILDQYQSDPSLVSKQGTSSINYGNYTKATYDNAQFSPFDPKKENEYTPIQIEDDYPFLNIFIDDFNGFDVFNNIDNCPEDHNNIYDIFGDSYPQI